MLLKIKRFINQFVELGINKLKVSYLLWHKIYAELAKFLSMLTNKIENHLDAAMFCRIDIQYGIIFAVCYYVIPHCAWSYIQLTDTFLVFCDIFAMTEIFCVINFLNKSGRRHISNLMPRPTIILI